ncbi:MAG: dimethyladenosine transferase, rRNA (adenine1518-N6/adenine1519-N6)-dimethyltransferase [Candidatus Parcubacteria bacterium]|jgi:16S rRNA (adenine1518-N6/adenine1519-N6)-dimethyltransferase
MRSKPTNPSFAHKKSLGQNFLTSPVVPSLMCTAGRVEAGDRVLEIGPGTGALTKTLLALGAKVTAIETDDRAIAILNETFAAEITAHQLVIIAADIRHTPIPSVFDTTLPYKVIANIPYYLSGYLLRLVLELDTPPQLIVFLMQKEVVHRITRDKKSSLLSLSVAVYGTASYVKTISRGHFSPPPQVDSAILLIDHIHKTNLPTPPDRERFFDHLHLGLGHKRKQLLGALAEKFDRSSLEQLFAELNLKPTVRGEDLSIVEWLALSKKLHQLGS